MKNAAPKRVQNGVYSNYAFAQSPSDFTSKLHIALKEANETMNWLNLLHDVDHLSDQAFESMAADCNELIALLVSSIKTIKNNNK